MLFILPLYFTPSPESFDSSLAVIHTPFQPSSNARAYFDHWSGTLSCSPSDPILVSLGCCNKVTHARGLLLTYFLKGPEARSSRSRCQQGEFLLKPLSLAVFSLCLFMIIPLCVSVLTCFSYKDTVYWIRIHFNDCILT